MTRSDAVRAGLACALLTSAVGACRPRPAVDDEPATCPMVTPQALPQLMPLLDDAAEISGLDFHPQLGLLIAPQYPGRFSGALYRMPPERLQRWIESNESLPLLPVPVSGLEELQDLEGYEGVEALVAFGDERVALLVEQRTSQGMAATLIVGSLSSEGADLRSTASCRVQLTPRAQNPNQSLEALHWDEQGGRLLAFAELNGPPLLSGRATAYAIDPSNCEVAELAMDPIPFRVTDVASLGEPADGSAASPTTGWVSINYQWNGDAELSAIDTLRFNCYPGARGNGGVEERLVRWEIDGDEARAQAALLLALDSRARNWEGLARVPGGWIIATDKHPDTRFAFVPDTAGSWLPVQAQSY